MPHRMPEPLDPLSYGEGRFVDPSAGDQAGMDAGGATVDESQGKHSQSLRPNPHALDGPARRN